MIIEFFGPPGSGKTTFAHALAERLRSSGHRAHVVLSHRPSDKPSRYDSLGLWLFVGRILSAILSTINILVSSRGRREDLPKSLSMIRLIPPAKRIWRLRLGQYIMHLASSWRTARKSPDIVIFDQGYVQAIGSLAIFNGMADRAALSKALSMAPQADFAVRVVTPRAVVENRLRQRMDGELPAERMFEADIEVNMRSIGVFDEISGLMTNSDRKFISIDTMDSQSTFSNLLRVEKELLARMPKNKVESPGHELQIETVAATKHCERDGKLERDQAVDPQQPASPSKSAVRAETGRRLAHASVFALSIYILGAGITSLAQFAIARLIGSHSYGIYAYALAWTSVLAYLATLGFNVSLLRFLPSYKAKGQLDLAKGVISFALQRSLLAAVLTAMTGAAIIYFSSHHLYDEHEISMLLGMAAIPLITAYALGGAIIRAFGGVISALLPERIVRDGLLLVLLGAVAMSGSWTMNAGVVMSAMLVSSAVTVILVTVIAIKLRPAGLWQADVRREPARWWSAVPPIMLIAGLDVFISRTGIMVLGWTGHIREAGIFALGLNVALLVGLSRIAVGTMFSPTAADLHTRGDREALQILFARATVLCASGALLVAVPLLIIVEPLLGWFGEDFVSGAPIARILIMGYLLVAAFGPQQNLLQMTGNEWVAANTIVAGAVVNVVACAIGIALNGVVGAAIGIALAMLVWCVSMAVYINKRLDILPGLFYASLAMRSGAVRKP